MFYIMYYTYEGTGRLYCRRSQPFKQTESDNCASLAFWLGAEAENM